MTSSTSPLHSSRMRRTLGVTSWGNSLASWRCARPPQVLLPRLQLDRNCIHNCPNISFRFYVLGSNAISLPISCCAMTCLEHWLLWSLFSWLLELFFCFFLILLNKIMILCSSDDEFNTISKGFSYVENRFFTHNFSIGKSCLYCFF